jgi:hypothetical protein
MPALKMAENNFIIEWQKSLAWTLAALYAGFFADTSYPFIAADW